MKQFVFFDLDGTVLDTLEDLCDSVNTALTKFGFGEITLEETAANLGNGAKHLIEASAHSRLSDEKIAEILDFYKPYYEAHCQIKTAPYVGTLELMDELKKHNIKMAIVSNKPAGATAQLAEKWFEGRLDYAQGESPETRRKPAPDMLFAAMKALGAGLEDSVYVGDTEVDIETAANAGMDVIAVSWGFRSRESLEKTIENTDVSKIYCRIADNREELLGCILSM